MTRGITQGILVTMKTAISLPDTLFAAADRVAKKLRMSRSQLYATAVEEFVAQHDSQEVTERLDAVYGQQPASVDVVLEKLQARSLPKEDW